MTTPVDVLAVLDALSLQTKQRGGSPSFVTIDEARAAVAELIEAAEPFAARNSSEGVTVHIGTEQVARLRAALAGVGGTK